MRLSRDGRLFLNAHAPRCEHCRRLLKEVPERRTVSDDRGSRADMTRTCPGCGWVNDAGEYGDTFEGPQAWRWK